MYNESCIIKLDLDGDNVEETIKLNESGKYISIDDTNYMINKYFKESNDTNSVMYNNYNKNQYYILDLNDDGILEIIHRTYGEMISPSTSKYTIYNFKDHNLNEIAGTSIIGNIPNEIYVKENTIQFEYWPYESQKNTTKKVILELDI